MCEAMASVISPVFHHNVSPGINSSTTNTMSPGVHEQLSAFTESKPVLGFRKLLPDELSQKQAVPSSHGRAAILGSRECLMLYIGSAVVHCEGGLPIRATSGEVRAGQ